MIPKSLAFLQTDFLQDRNLSTDTEIVSLPPCLVALHKCKGKYNQPQALEQFPSKHMFDEWNDMS